MGDHKKIEDIEAEIKEEFSLFDSWDDKYEYIIDLGKRLSPLDEKYKIDENRVRPRSQSCVSPRRPRSRTAWLPWG